MDNTISEAVFVFPVERKDGTIALRVCLEQGEFPLALLQRVVKVLETYDLKLRVAMEQRANIEGVIKENLDEVVAALGAVVRKCPPGVTTCAGAESCKYGLQETRELGKRLRALIEENGPYPFKIKSGVSGCKMSCGLSFVRDIGFVGGPKGWDVYFGGCATRQPGRGVLLGSGLGEDAALRLVADGLRYYKENGKKRERIGGMVRRLGHETVSAALA